MYSAQYSHGSTSAWGSRTNSISIIGAGINISNADSAKFLRTFVGEDAVGVFVGSSGGGFSGMSDLVELNILSHANISLNAEVSHSLGVNSLFSVGFVACAAVSEAFSCLFNIGG